MPPIKDTFKNILVSVIGLTPQIITETLYYLTCKKKPSIKISEIYAITTEPGKNMATELLLDKKSGAFYAFCKDYSIDHTSIKFDETTISVLKDAEGNNLSDIRTADENKVVADTVTDFIRKLTNIPDTRLHCSIAGGRKTMGIYLAYALQLFGRPQDKLYHILVSPEFESHPDFFYKPKKNRILILNDTQNKIKRINTKSACVELAEIPFVHLGHKLPILFGEKSLSYTRMVARAQREIDNTRALSDLMIDIPERRVRIGTRSVKLQPLELVVLLRFARRKLDECAVLNKQNCNDCNVCFEEIRNCTSIIATKKMLKDYAGFYSTDSGFYQNLAHRWSEHGATHECLRENISRINRAIGSITDSNLYQVSSIRKYGQTRYGIRLDRSKIKIANRK